jgi:hypothetical protein
MRLWGGLRRKSCTYLDDTAEHVTDKGGAGFDLGPLLVVTEPHAETDEVALALFCLLLHNLHLDGHVGEIFTDGTTGTLNSYNSSLDGHLDYIIGSVESTSLTIVGDLEPFFRQNLSHFALSSLLNNNKHSKHPTLHQSSFTN